MDNQTEEKKEEGKRGEWVGVSIGFPFGGLWEPNIYHDLGVDYKNGEFTWNFWGWLKEKDW